MRAGEEKPHDCTFRSTSASITRPRAFPTASPSASPRCCAWCADTFFAKRYGHRAVVLETVAAVPGMVGATINHLDCLRRMCDDKGWIKTLMDEAENERMHLMTFIEIAQPTLFERAGHRRRAVGLLPRLLRLYLVRPGPPTASSAISRKRR